MAEAELTLSTRLAREIKEMSSLRVLIFTLAICGILLSMVWRKELQPVYLRLQQLEKQVPAPELLRLDAEMTEGLRAQVKATEHQLKAERSKVIRFAKERDISLKPDVYVKAVGALNRLIGGLGLALVEYEEVSGPHGRRPTGAANELSRYVGEFTQTYHVRGDFPRTYQLVEELNQFPFLCRVSDITLEANADFSKGDATGPRIIDLRFTVTFYYLRATQS